MAGAVDRADPQVGNSVRCGSSACPLPGECHRALFLWSFLWPEWGVGGGSSHLCALLTLPSAHTGGKFRRWQLHGAAPPSLAEVSESPERKEGGRESKQKIKGWW